MLYIFGETLSMRFGPLVFRMD